MIQKKEMVMRYFSFDLSFTGTGVCMMDDEHKTIMFWQVKTNLEKQKTFENVQKAISSVMADVGYILSCYDQLGEMKIIMEQPLVGGCWSAGLYGLDSAFYQRFRQSISKTFHPNTLKKVMGKHTKKDSLRLAQNIIADLEACGWKAQQSGKLTDDQAEALIYNTLYHIEEKHSDFIEMYQSLNCDKIFNN